MKIKRLIYFISILFCFNLYGQETYKIGKTEYYFNKTYTSTGYPVVKRSEANKKEFLKKYGLNETPEGYEIDHIIPLSEGGTDDPSNMQLLTVEQHKLKTARERSNRSDFTYSLPKVYTTSSTYSKKYIQPVSTSTNSTTSSSYSRTDTKGRIIYKGSRGGEYYINGNGNKVYVKSSINSYTPTYYTPTTSSSSSRTIHTGPRGGKYYINSNGNKTYVKKN